MNKKSIDILIDQIALSCQYYRDDEKAKLGRSIEMLRAREREVVEKCFALVADDNRDRALWECDVVALRVATERSFDLAESAFFDKRRQVFILALSIVGELVEPTALTQMVLKRGEQLGLDEIAPAGLRSVLEKLTEENDRYEFFARCMSLGIPSKGIPTIGELVAEANSVLAMQWLIERIRDVFGGGDDLLFPTHYSRVVESMASDIASCMLIYQVDWSVVEKMSMHRDYRVRLCAAYAIAESVKTDIKPNWREFLRKRHVGIANFPSIKTMYYFYGDFARPDFVSE